MPENGSTLERRKISFSMSELSAEIVAAALTGPVPGRYMEFSEVVREAVFEWGIVHLQRERSGGMRLIRGGDVPQPFGSMREARLIQARRTVRDADGGAPERSWLRRTATLTPMLDEMLKTAVEDPRGREFYPNRSAAIDFAILQWGLTHLELEFTADGWDLRRPLALKHSLDFDGGDNPLQTDSFREVTAKPVFSEDEFNFEFSQGYTDVCFYRAGAGSRYLDEVSDGRYACPDNPDAERRSRGPEGASDGNQPMDASDFLSRYFADGSL